MTVPSASYLVVRTAVSPASGVAIPYAAPVLAATDLTVFYGASGTAKMTINTHYTVAIAGDYSSASVTLTPAGAALAAGYAATVARVVPLSQTLDLVTAQRLPSNDVEKALDRIVMGLQQVADAQSRSISVPVGQVFGSGAYDASNNRIGNLANPSVATDAATKAYVDSIAVAAGNVTPPGGGAVGYVLTALSATLWGWVALPAFPTSFLSTAISDSTSFGRALLTAVSVAAQRTALGLGAMALKAAVAISDITATGTASAATFLRGDGAWAAPPASPFTVSYDSGNQTITTAGTLSLTHGLGAIPKLVQLFLVCQTAEFGFSVGDTILVNHGGGTLVGATTGNPASTPIVRITTTQILITYGSATVVFQVVRADTGNVASLTNTNWRMIVRAYA